MTPDEATRRLEGLQSSLSESARTLAPALAEQIVADATRLAGSRPTPQAALAAEALAIERTADGALVSIAPTTVASRSGAVFAPDIAGGAEYGSNIYTQFGRAHNSRGYWLGPSATDEVALLAAERHVDQQIDEAVR